MHSWKNLNFYSSQKLVTPSINREFAFWLKVIYRCWPYSSVTLPWITCIKSPSAPVSGDVRQAICDRVTQLLETHFQNYVLTLPSFSSRTGRSKNFPSKYECFTSPHVRSAVIMLEFCHDGFSPGQQAFRSSIFTETLFYGRTVVHVGCPIHPSGSNPPKLCSHYLSQISRAASIQTSSSWHVP
jgi:hypothetical protein